MMEDIMVLAIRSADQADAVVKTDATTSLRFHGDALQEAHYAESKGANLRLVVDGRIGRAGTTASGARSLVEAAVASARIGDEGRMFYPEPAPTSNPKVHDPAVASAGLDDLELYGALIGDQLTDGRTAVDIHLERSVGDVHVANSRGVDESYQVTGVAVDITATRTYGARTITARSWWGGSGLPTDDDVVSLTLGLGERLDWGETGVTVADGPATVCLTSRAVASFLRPIRQALRGTSLYNGVSPLADRVGAQVTDRCVTLVDDPLLDWRPGSRPIDDEGVVCRRLPLIEDGIFRSGIYDLETAALVGLPATGHGRRTTFGKPQAAYTNLEMLPGASSWDQLLDATGDGLVVDGFHGVGRGFPASGTFRAPASLAYRVSEGTIVGQVPGVRLSGNVFRCLDRVLALGDERQWLGSVALPAMVVEGFQLAA